MKVCKRCTTPETWAGIKFDEEGVCSACRQVEYKLTKIDWAAREKMLVELLNKHKELAKQQGNKYDCIVPFSGGKDSTFALWVLRKKYKMNPLVCTFGHMWFTPEGLYNLFNGPQRLGCDHVMFSVGHELMEKLAVEGMKIFGDFCWHCHAGVGSYPMRVAVQYKVPLVIWGEPTAAEYGSGPYTYDDFEEQDEKHFERQFLAGVTGKEFIGKSGITERDLKSFQFPSLDELREVGVRGIYLGNYIPWDVRKQVEINKREVGWKERDIEGCYVRWDNVECKYVGVRDWAKYLKRGFGRSMFRASVDIRHGRMTRDEAMKLAEKYDGKKPASLDEFLKEVGMTEEEFNEYALKSVVPPWKPDLKKLGIKTRTKK